MQVVPDALNPAMMQVVEEFLAALVEGRKRGARGGNGVLDTVLSEDGA